MGDFYSTITGIHYSSKEQREAMEKKYMADLENKKIEEQKKANKLQQQQIQMQQNLEQERLRQQQELIESQRQAMLEAEEYRQQEEKKRQIMQNVYNEIQRKKELCDKEGIVYSDIVSFANKLIKPDKKMQTKLEEEKNKYEDLLNKAKEKEMFKDALKIIDEEKHKLGSAPNEKKYKGSSIFFAIVCGVMSIILVPTFFDNSILMGAGWIVGIIIAIICIHFFMKSLYKYAVDVYINNLKKIDTKEKGVNFNLEELNKLDIKKELEETEKNIRQLEDECQKQINENKNKFNQFRKTHYNDTMEKLLRNLELDTIDVIREKESSKKGSKEDYIRFIEENL